MSNDSPNPALRAEEAAARVEDSKPQAAAPAAQPAAAPHRWPPRRILLIGHGILFLFIGLWIGIPWIASGVGRPFPPTMPT